jgi:ribosomal protein L37AE/L43A
MSAYICKECKKPVEVKDTGEKLWSCEHTGFTIIANCEAVVSQSGGIKNK